MADENVVIRAAHMEIASPNIPEGLQSLLQERVGTCCQSLDVCFLSIERNSLVKFSKTKLFVTPIF